MCGYLIEVYTETQGADGRLAVSDSKSNDFIWPMRDATWALKKDSTHRKIRKNKKTLVPLDFLDVE
jgi:hypothetical protein